MLVVLFFQGDGCLGCIISSWANKMNRKREKKYIQSDQPSWKPGGASATPQSRKFPVFDCAVSLCTMWNALSVINILTWLNLISQNVSWFDRLRVTNVWAALSSDEQTKWTERERKNAFSQTSRLENPEELQLHHNHEKFLFLTVLSLFAQCKMHYRWLISWLDLTWQGIVQNRSAKIIAAVASHYLHRYVYCYL
jgi:hypothetical protein